MNLLFALKLLFCGIAVAALSYGTATVVTAHGGREVGEYELKVGFMNEPAYEGLMNGVDLQIEVAETGAPIDGLDQTLQVEVTHISSGGSKTLEMQPVKNEPGRYTVEFIPTAPGEFQFRFFGTIEGMALDETFESGPDHFSTIESARELQIPEPLPEMRELGAAVRGSTETADQAQRSAATATGLAIAGLLLGAIGAVAGVGSLLIARKRAADQLVARTGAEKPSTTG